jgi:soluble lytic murein transglycosylase-like protein
MLRVQDLLFPAVLLGCLTVIFLTNLVSQPEKVTAAPLASLPAPTGQATDLLANLNLETIVEAPTQTTAAQIAIKPTAKAKVKAKAKKKSTSQSSASSDTSNNNQSSSSSGCSVAPSFPSAVIQWCGLIDKYAQQQNLDPNLVAAVIDEESGGNPQAYSSSGAVGLMQIMPRDGLAANFTCGASPCFSSRPAMNELYDPETNIAYGTRMLGSLYNKYGNVRDALLAYGPTGMGYSYADIVLGIYDRYK